ncbi:peptide-methionine (S)-S-oxide reductase MsrA [Paenibacillus sp. NPDC058071]|uniref:peptide-methionine (S)-S-oxide reductase MsrA n=1 Tax=Paenibacillus sp. NPDC058071 TaxID=3346326 RepID=UPI0036DDF890
MRIDTATFGMGCFWSPEALFGQLPGVISTQTGYAGGAAEYPTYRNMGDHTETVQLRFDPSKLPFESIVRLFWNSHNPNNINGYKGDQYKSLLFWQTEEQRDAIGRVLQERNERGETGAETEVCPYEHFWPAEDRHQKYYLKRYPDAVRQLELLFLHLDAPMETTLAARLNGVAKGYANLSAVKDEIADSDIDEGEKERLIAAISRIRW